MRSNNRAANWKYLGLVALIAMPVTLVTPRLAQAAEKITAKTQQAATDPVQISGTVRQYFTNRAGYVTALNLETASGTEQVRFAPSWAKRLLDHHAVGEKLDGWVIPHHKKGETWNDLVSLGAERPQRFLTDKFHSGAQKLDDGSWVWKKSKNVRITGQLDKVVINDKGDVLALVLNNGALIRVPRTVRNEELGAAGTDAIAPLFKNVDVTAWGPREWQARGDVSLYNQYLATDGISINGRPVSAIGIPRFPVNGQTLSSWNINPIGAQAVEVIGVNGEYSPFDINMAAKPLPYAFTGSVGDAHVGRAMLQTDTGEFYPAVHEGLQVFVLADRKTHEMPLVNGAYQLPTQLPNSKLVMVMDDGRQFDMESSGNQLFVILPDGNKSPVHL